MIKVIGRTGCKACSELKDRLEGEGIEFEYLKLDEMSIPDKREYTQMARDADMGTLPIVIKDGEIVKDNERLFEEYVEPNVVKRDGSVTRFDSDKIYNAINKAADETESGVDYELARDIADSIEDIVMDFDVSPSVEFIQDLVEDHLMCSERRDIAKTYILYREKRNQLREQGWEMTDLQKDIYEKKYRFDGESFDEFLDRISGGNSKIKKLMRGKKFLPAGRILAGRGLNEKGKKVCYSNCFVITPPEDNLESIFDTAKKMARTYSLGGGCGTDLGKLRPRDSVVNNAAQFTTGAISFSELYSMTTGLIGMKNRRGK